MSLRVLLIIFGLTIVICNCTGKAIVDNFSELIDSETPEGAYLSAIYKRSFSYIVINQRLPEIIRKALTDLESTKEKIVSLYGQAAELEVDTAISQMNRLITEIKNNDIMRNISSEAPDADFYNDYLAAQASKILGAPRYHYVQVIPAEAYTYRRMREIFESTEHLKSFDPFEMQKNTAFQNSLPLIKRIAGPLINLTSSKKDAEKKELINLLKINLWGNRCDLSHGSCLVNKEGENLMDTDSMDTYLLSDETENIWLTISSETTESNTVDIVMDNVAYELFTDLCLADYIISRGLADTVRFYVKTFPWFVSDTMRKDIYWIISEMESSQDENLAHLGEKWNNFLNNASWVIEEYEFFTLPVGYIEMKNVRPDLYRKIGESKLVIFKGDLNYRKLFHEKNWPPTTPIQTALEGFHPTKIAILRTVKSETVCALNSNILQQVSNVANWKTSGQYGVIQFSDKIIYL